MTNTDANTQVTEQSADAQKNINWTIWIIGSIAVLALVIGMLSLYQTHSVEQKKQEARRELLNKYNTELARQRTRNQEMFNKWDKEAKERNGTKPTNQTP